MSSGGSSIAALDLGVGGEPLDLARGLEPVVQALGPGARRGTADRSPGASGRPTRARHGLGRPGGPGTWPPSRAGAWSVSGSASSAVRTASQRSTTSRFSGVSSSRSTYFFACSRYSHWSCTARDRAPVGERDARACTSRSREISCSACTGFWIDRSGRNAVLDHLEHDRGGPDLQERRDLAHVRVADDHVQPPVPLGVGVRLVARVDDRALQGRLEPDLGLEEVRALRELEHPAAPLVPRRLGADLAGAREHDAGRRRTASGRARCRANGVARSTR